LEREQRKIQTRLENSEYEFTNKISNLERDLTKERQEYDDITNKYELLEKDFVEMKSRLIKEKDTLVEAISSIRKSYDEKLTEIKSLKEALSSRQKEWFKEKLDYQEKIAGIQMFTIFNSIYFDSWNESGISMEFMNSTAFPTILT
jgi:predicted  nucleic acid-binding Zn-ribbon protein